MPIYSYKCPCGFSFDALSRLDQQTHTCPACTKRAKRNGVSRVSIHFKGAGWTPKGNK